MNRLIVYFLLLAAGGACLLSACSKADQADTRISGHVVDSETKQPLKGVQVSIQFIDGDAGMGLNLGNYTLGQAYTSDAGSFDFSFDAKSTNSPADYYRITVGGDMGHAHQIRSLPCSEADRKVSALSVALWREVEVAIKLVHDGPPDADDYIQAHIAYFPWEFGYSLTANGDVAETTNVIRVTPRYPTAFSWFKKHGGVWSGSNYFRDTVVFHGDGETYTIHY